MESYRIFHYEIICDKRGVNLFGNPYVDKCFHLKCRKCDLESLTYENYAKIYINTL